MLSIRSSVLGSGIICGRIYDSLQTCDMYHQDLFLLKCMINVTILYFDIVNFPFLDEDIPRAPSYGVYISQLIRFARVSNHVADINTRNKILTAKLLKQGYRYHKLRKIFSKFYKRHYDLVSNFNVGLKSLLKQGLSEPEFYADLVCKFRKIVGRKDFLINLRKSFVIKPDTT